VADAQQRVPGLPQMLQRDLGELLQALVEEMGKSRYQWGIAWGFHQDIMGIYNVEYIYIYTYICTYIYTYIYIYI
jgi:hypothetical protein